MKWAVFLDRDGAINQEINYLSQPEQLRLLPGAPAAIRRLTKLNIPVIVVTNQSGLARGYFSLSALRAIHHKLRRLLAAEGAHVNRFYYCPHLPSEGCKCRKPEPGLLLEAAEELDLDLSRSFMIGDKLTDLQAGRRAGCQTILVTTGYGADLVERDTSMANANADFVAPDLGQAVDWVLEQQAPAHSPVYSHQLAQSAVPSRPPSKPFLGLKSEFLPIALLALLLLVLIAGGVSSFPSPLALLRLLLGLLFVLVLPGYLIQAAIFPRRDDIDGPERAALSFGLSLAIIPLVALILDALPWGLFQWPIVIAEGLISALAGGVLWFRRRRLPKSAQFLPAISFQPRRWWAAQDRVTKRLVQIVGVALLLALIGASAILFLPRPQDSFTEFYLLGPEGLAENYPREATVGQPLTVDMTIVNREREGNVYRVELWAAETWSDRQALVGQSGPFTVEEGQAVEETLSWSMPWAGEEQQVNFYLYKMDQESNEPYRRLRLWLNVSE